MDLQTRTALWIAQHERQGLKHVRPCTADELATLPRLDCSGKGAQVVAHVFERSGEMYIVRAHYHEKKYEGCTALEEF